MIAIAMVPGSGRTTARSVVPLRAPVSGAITRVPQPSDSLRKVLLGLSEPEEPRSLLPGISLAEKPAEAIAALRGSLTREASSGPGSVVFFGLATGSLMERADSRTPWLSEVVAGVLSGFVVSRTVTSLDGRADAEVQPLLERRHGKVRVGVTGRF